MPIDKSKYPADWDLISLRIRKDRASDRCECTGECGLHESHCDAMNAEPHPVTGSKVVLTVAHLDQDTYNNLDSNLLAMCQRCHLTYDRHYYKRQRLVWAKTIDNTTLSILLSAIDNYAVDVIGQMFGSKARAIWGEDYIECLDEIRTVLQDEWERRNSPPPDIDL